MSHEATNWAIKQRGLSPAAKLVLWHLCDRYNPDHGCFPKQSTLAQDCEMARSTINERLKELEASGLVRRERRRDEVTRRQRSTRYVLAFEADFENGVRHPDTDPVTGRAASGVPDTPVSDGSDVPVFDCPDTYTKEEPVRLNSNKITSKAHSEFSQKENTQPLRPDMEPTLSVGGKEHAKKETRELNGCTTPAADRQDPPVESNPQAPSKHGSDLFELHSLLARIERETVVRQTSTTSEMKRA